MSVEVLHLKGTGSSLKKGTNDLVFTWREVLKDKNVGLSLEKILFYCSNLVLLREAGARWLCTQISQSSFTARYDQTSDGAMTETFWF